MSIPLATDWAEVLVPPVWSALVAVALLALAWFWRVPLSRGLNKIGISRLNVMGVDLIASQAEDAYRARNMTAPGARELRAFGALGLRLEPLVRGRRVLWVDDLPETHEFEARLLRGLGVEIENVLGTEEALERLRRDRACFDLLITDWTRGEDGEAGPKLLARLGEDFPLPVLMYVGEDPPERRARAAELGASGLTRDPDELLKQVLVELATAR